VRRLLTILVLLGTALAAFGTVRLLLPARDSSTKEPEAVGAAILLTDVTAEWGVPFPHFGGRRENLLPEDMGSGIAIGDYDGDGDPDLFVPAINALRSFLRPGTPQVSNLLLRNDGRGQLVDVTEQAGLRFRGVGMGALFVDLDGDGWLDLLVTNFGPDLLYRNLGDGRFARVADPGISGAGFSGGASCGDVDGDGDLDLYIPSYVHFDLHVPPAPPASSGPPPPLAPKVQRLLQAEDELFETPPPYGILPVNFRPVPNHLWRNDGGFRFTDITATAGVADAGGRSLQSLLVDLDGDGDLDLFVANDVSENRLFLNRGDGRFQEASLPSGLLDPRGAMGATIAELNQDGLPDVIIANYSTDGLALYLSAGLQDGIPRYRRGEEMARLVDSTLGRVGWSVGLHDLDLDGDLDLYETHGHIRNLVDDPTRLGPQTDSLFRALGGPVFEHLEGARGGVALEAAGVGRGAAFVDLDGDGDEDIVICRHGQGLRFLRNDSQRGGGSLRVRLAGRPPNLFAVGARVRLGGPGGIQERWILAGQGYLGNGSDWPVFGLPEGRPAAWIEVTWPGTRQPVRYPGPFAPDRPVTLRQP